MNNKTIIPIHVSRHRPKIHVRIGDLTPRIEHEVVDVCVKKSSIPKAGLGVFATRDISKGQDIRGAEFAGKFILDEMINEKNKHYVRLLRGRVLIDASQSEFRSSLHGGLINCPRGVLEDGLTKPKKNVEHHLVVIGKGGLLLATRATRKIQKGEELFVPYNWSAAEWRRVLLSPAPPVYS